MGNGSSRPFYSCNTGECNRCDALVDDCVQDLQLTAATDEMKPSKEQHLIRAARDGNTYGVIEHLKSGADVNARQPLKLITLDRYHSGQPIRNCGLTPLMYAASNGHSDVIKVLVQSRARVNDADERGVTALHLAAASGDFSSFSELLAAKASPHFLTEEGENVLDYLPQTVLEDGDLLQQFHDAMPQEKDQEVDFAVASESKPAPKKRRRKMLYQ
ncbi:unnamed protein product [Effrenium voratum]|nr:unnamed protein product [Effrenium voratum]